MRGGVHMDGLRGGVLLAVLRLRRGLGLRLLVVLLLELDLVLLRR